MSYTAKDPEKRPLLALVDQADPPDVATYERGGGFRGLRRVLSGLSPAEVIDEVTKSKLRGRGGAGFSTGMKWSFVPKESQKERKKYIVANGDEMEPGTFKDRLLVEGNPLQLVEGMIISAYAIQASHGVIFLRGEYHLGLERLKIAVEQAKAAGFLGENILGSGFDFELIVHPSGGRYICGEETALLTALEGRRANPRTKPPFPQVSGLWGAPTVVNNIETFSNIPHIMANGIDWYLGLSACGDGGTKLYGVSGRAKRPGVYELPLGTRMGILLEECAGGMQDGYRLRAFLPGGASTAFLGAEHADIVLDYPTPEKAGSRLGTGLAILLDDRASPIGMIRNLEHFFAQESCGWCTPCRDGLPWVEKLLIDIEEGRGGPDDILRLQDACRLIGPMGRTFCAHAPGAIAPLESGLRLFREDFERAVQGGGAVVPSAQERAA
ncbi:NADH-quinone oxidoreductase chain F [Neoasaia chiangmaiensis NBRC 101099]|uniref:NADH-quinone oxidoreductase subunit F n=1 Tax=Neoasaia chiangmaiensis TaxID=320497 RepID=A0A1U9KSC5_9PROT|nr:NADH-ubiquinone oxidoreductase-F iron-sulfur binding region domain-containing protein [Neoasaia chiangmaiensis]AQS88662.1 NADH-quinone oxidoreductase subunit F [Neoasaia chiangmaiensis]GBR41116.1 NADH-quinone oxidoreductase chain F [Neoasaia chiangmaiensis NBRC 101099]GEN13605.1 NADH-quinone oxidoreductase subunit F [Neoasaia chiangmaiensis]